MAGPAQALKPVRVVGVLARLALHRHDVIALKATGPAAHDAAPTIALEYGAANGGPSANVELDVVAAH